VSGFSTFQAFQPNAFDPDPAEDLDYILTAPLVWAIGQKHSTWLLTVAENEVFDLSVPPGLRWLQSPHDRKLLPAAAVHDELLKRGFDRPFAAAEFRRAARARGVRPWRAWALFFAVLAWTSRPVSGLS
jgi:hypothetical protein